MGLLISQDQPGAKALNLNFEGAYVGNLSDVNFIVQHELSDGQQAEFPVNIGNASFTVPAYGKVTNGFIASFIFTTVFNRALNKVQDDLRGREAFFVNPIIVKLGFIKDVNLYMNNFYTGQLGSIFGGSAIGKDIPEEKANIVAQ